MTGLPPPSTRCGALRSAGGVGTAPRAQQAARACEFSASCSSTRTSGSPVGPPPRRPAPWVARAASQHTDVADGPAAAAASHATAVQTVAERAKDPLMLSFAGGGIFFFWQLGTVKYLREHMDLSKASMVGASAGAIIAVLAACGVDPDVALESAYRLSLDHDIWERPMGLLGVWGGIIRSWLDELLPDDAHERCEGRIEIITTQAMMGLPQVVHSNFTSKEDLIDGIMASAHVPFVLDWKPATNFRGELHLDGSLADFIQGENSEYLTRDGATLILDYSMDEALTAGYAAERMSFLTLRSYEDIVEIMDMGYRYAGRLHRDGVIDGFDWTHISLSSMDEEDC